MMVAVMRVLGYACMVGGLLAGVLVIVEIVLAVRREWRNVRRQQRREARDRDHFPRIPTDSA